METGAIPYFAFPNIGYAISASNGGRVSLPVEDSAYIYTHFKHVSLTPAPNGSEGVNVSQLQMLDTLIDQLAKMREEPVPFFSDSTESAEKQLASLIEYYQNQIRMSQAENAPYALATPASGAVLNVSA